MLVALDCHSTLWYADMTCMLAAQHWTVSQFMEALSQEAEQYAQGPFGVSLSGLAPQRESSSQDGLSSPL